MFVVRVIETPEHYRGENAVKVGFPLETLILSIPERYRWYDADEKRNIDEPGSNRSPVIAISCEHRTKRRTN